MIRIAIETNIESESVAHLDGHVMARARFVSTVGRCSVSCIGEIGLPRALNKHDAAVNRTHPVHDVRRRQCVDRDDSPAQCSFSSLDDQKDIAAPRQVCSPTIARLGQTSNTSVNQSEGNTLRRSCDMIRIIFSARMLVAREAALPRNDDLLRTAEYRRLQRYLVSPERR